MTVHNWKRVGQMLSGTSIKRWYKKFARRRNRRKAKLNPESREQTSGPVGNRLRNKMNEEFDPDNRLFHELFDRSYVVAQMFEDYISDHPSAQHPELKPRIAGIVSNYGTYTKQLRI